MCNNSSRTFQKQNKTQTIHKHTYTIQHKKKHFKLCTSYDWNKYFDWQFLRSIDSCMYFCCVCVCMFCAIFLFFSHWLVINIIDHKQYDYYENLQHFKWKKNPLLSSDVKLKVQFFLYISKLHRYYHKIAIIRRRYFFSV